jgi:hypothetical protein
LSSTTKGETSGREGGTGIKNDDDEMEGEVVKVVVVVVDDVDDEEEVADVLASLQGFCDS